MFILGNGDLYRVRGMSFRVTCMSTEGNWNNGYVTSVLWICEYRVTDLSVIIG